MGRRWAAIVVSFGVGAALLAPSPAGATGLEVEASVDVLAALSSSGYYGAAATFSDDLSTAAYFDINEQTGTPEDFYVVDVASDTRREVVLPRSSTGLERLVALNADGSTALFFADWEGVAAGDADGGLADAFLLDTATGDLTMVSGGIDDVSVVPLALDNAGDTALLAVYTSNTEGSLYLLDQGVLEELTGLTDDAIETSYLATLSGDGLSLLYASNIGFQTRWHVRTLATGDESVVAAPNGQPFISDDGSRVVASVYAGETSSTLVTWDTSTAQLVTRTIAGGVYNAQVNGSATTLVTSGFTYTEGEDDFAYELARVDVVTGERTVLASNQNTDVTVLAINEDADRIVVNSWQPLLPSFPVSLNEIYGGYGDSPATYIINLDGDPTPLALPGRVGSLDDQMARLYEAYFDRAPDDGGLTFWREQRAGGRSLDSVSDEFARSPEFAATYGDLGDEAFVDLVYQNVLDRAPDAGGRAFWLDQLANGRTRGSLMTLFSESPEFIETTGTVAAPSSTEAAVGRLYAAMFGRPADEAGLAHWVSEVNRGVPLDDVAWHFMRTEEFQGLYGGVEFDPYTMIMVVYRNGLGRDIDNAGYELAEQHYSQGRPIEELIVEVTNSAAFVAATSTTPISG